MTTKKNIESIIAPRAAHFVGDGFRVHNFIPSGNQMGAKRMDPFIMLDYNSKFYFPPSDKPRGVDVHPHRGFETVTIAYEGSVAHHDSSGNSGIIAKGDVQWMTAASGILHKEFHEETYSKAGGDFQMVQLWVNLPAKDKMSTPKYQALDNASIPKHPLDDKGSFLELIAGSYKTEQGAATTFSPIHVFNAHLKKDGKADFDFPENYNTALLVVQGEITVNGEAQVKGDHFALFENKGTAFSVEATADSIVLILSGDPLLEPIVSHGPFVMNTQQEIIEAIEDFNNGKFGNIPS